MKPTLLGFGIILATGSLFAQTQPAPAPTAADLQRQIATLEQQAKAEQTTVDNLQAKVRTADAEFEKRITRLTDSVKRLADSKDSGTRVLRLKQDLIASLRKLIEFYNRERGQRIAALEQANTKIPKAELKKQVANLDDRIERRVNQIMELAQSFPVPKDVPKMVQRGGGGYYDYSYEATNPEYQRQKRLGSYSEMSRTDLIDALKASVENLKRQNINLERAAQQATTNDEREFFQQRLSENRERIDKRRQQISALLTDKTPGNRPISTKEYQTAADQVEDVIKDLKQDLRALLQLINNRDVARQRLQNIQAGIAYRQRLLATAKP